MSRFSRTYLNMGNLLYFALYFIIKTSFEGDVYVWHASWLRWASWVVQQGILGCRITSSLAGGNVYVYVRVYGNSLSISLPSRDFSFTWQILRIAELIYDLNPSTTKSTQETASGVRRITISIFLECAVLKKKYRNLENPCVAKTTIFKVWAPRPLFLWWRAGRQGMDEGIWRFQGTDLAPNFPHIKIILSFFHIE